MSRIEDCIADWFMEHTPAVILFVCVVIIALIPAVIIHDSNERAEFMAYCTAKGINQDDCKWEYKRIKNGEKSSVIFYPMFIGR